MDPKYIVSAIDAIWSESGKYERMLEIELDNCEAWYAKGLIDSIEMNLIRAGCKMELFDWEVYDQRLKATRHDVGSFVYTVSTVINRLAEAAGINTSPGRWVHYLLTSYDPQDSALAMQVRETLDVLEHRILKLENALLKLGTVHWESVMIGRTHGMHAEPTTFGAKLANFYDQMQRHRRNLDQVRTEWSIVKISGPVGSHENVPQDVEEFIAEKLGIEPIDIATQVIPREMVLRYLNLLNEFGSTIEKMGSDLRDMQRPEICEVEEFFPEGAEGSSIMVHKHNPEVSERCCSLARQIAGSVVTARMNVVLWHERDLTNSANERSILYDSANAAVFIAGQMTWVIENLRVFPKRMRHNLELTAQIVRSGEVLNLLVKKGMDRSEARKIVADETNFAWNLYQLGGPMIDMYMRFRQLLVEHLALCSWEELRECFDPDYTRLLEGVKVSFQRLGWKTQDARQKEEEEVVSSSN